VKKTIYLPDELGQRVEADESLNVSAVCQTALEDELERRAALGKLSDNMETHTTYIEKLYRSEPGAPAGGVAVEADVEFVGKFIAADDAGLEVYLTQEHRIAVEDTERQELYVYEDFDDFQQRTQFPPGVFSEVADAIGERQRPVHLDI
jgi:post-segregation antitoxin (ccd killing protein)